MLGVNVRQSNFSRAQVTRMLRSVEFVLRKSVIACSLAAASARWFGEEYRIGGPQGRTWSHFRMCEVSVDIYM
jgi:hypothetical protein